MPETLGPTQVLGQRGAGPRRKAQAHRNGRRRLHTGPPTPRLVGKQTPDRRPPGSTGPAKQQLY